MVPEHATYCVAPIDEPNPVTTSPSSFETARLVIEILRRIPRTHLISTSDMRSQLAAAGFARNVRSIQRLLDELSQHYDIERNDRSKPYGYRWKPQASGLSLSALSDQESLLLLMAHRHLQTVLPSALLKSLDGLVDGARRKLDPAGGRKAARLWLNKVGIVSQLQPLRPATLKPGVIEAVTRALYEDLWLSIDYVNLEGRASQGRVMPLALVQQEARLFLVCRFEDHDDLRNLALHRIAAAQATGPRFERPEFDLEAYDDAGGFGFGRGRSIRLRFSVPKDIATILGETPLSADQVARTRRDGSVEISATVVDSGRLRWWLASYGDALKVLAPRSLMTKASSDQPRRADS